MASNVGQGFLHDAVQRDQRLFGQGAERGRQGDVTGQSCRRSELVDQAIQRRLYAHVKRWRAKRGGNVAYHLGGVVCV